MGKASSSKKVARAAGTGGGRTAGGKVPWSYYSVIGLVVILGILGTIVSRQDRNAKIANAGNTAPTVGGKAWNEAFAVYACGKFLPNVVTNKDPYGLTTQGDGIIHIHPFVKSAAGKNATLGKFSSSIGMKLNAAEIQVPGGHAYHDGDTCAGKASHVYVKQFAYAGDPSGQLLNQDPASILLADQEMLTIAFVPPGDKASIPAPPASVQAALKAAQAKASTTTTTLPTSATTLPTSSTTNVPSATTTVAPTTTATTKPSSTTAAPQVTTTSIKP